MSDTPDIPALRTISAERLVEGDIYWGIVHGPENRKGWATLESAGQPVLKVTHWKSRARRDIQVQGPDGPTTLGFFDVDQVLIEHKAHPNAVNTKRVGHTGVVWHSSRF